MSDTDENLALLPNGFVDILPPHAQCEAKSIAILIGIFESYGYALIKPPLLEFEDSLLAPGPGARLAPETFRLMDPVTHRMLGVRSDITSQIARIVSSRFKNEVRPVRLTYANDVLRTKGSQMRTVRQFTQVGCELITKEADIQADVEICVLSVLGLKSLGVENITLDFTVPGLVNKILEKASAKNKDAIKKAVAQRDKDALIAIGSEPAQMIAGLISARGVHTQAFDILENVPLTDDLGCDISRLRDVCDHVSEALVQLEMGGVDITLDFLEQSGFEYHKSLGFTLFSLDVSGELGRGGQYDVNFDLGENEDDTQDMASGFTLYMDTVSKIRKFDEDVKSILVNCACPWSDIQRLQSDGWVVLRNISGANKEQCSHEYDHNSDEIKEV